jgi:GNAT superfamily N-acetyltransferase
MFRRATAGDAGAVAALHVASWQRTYRGVFPDAYLDGPVVDDLGRLWGDRLAAPAPTDVTTLAVADGPGGERLVGFVHTVLDDDATWGALVDNLHVADDTQGTGVGTALLARAAGAVVTSCPSSGLYLWVFEQNTNARRFYESRGATPADRELYEVLDGIRAETLRYTWPTPSTLVGFVS